MRKKASKLAVLFILIGTTFLFYPQAYAAVVYADVTCANQDSTQQTYQIGWDNSNQFFENRGYIPRLFCEGGYAPPGFNVYVSDNLPDSSTGYYNGVVPTPVVIGPESPSETQTVTSETQTVSSQETATAQETVTASTSDSTTAVDSPTATSDTPTATLETSSATVDTVTPTSDTVTPVLPAETSTVDTQTVESIPTPVVTPLPEPAPVVQPEPVVVSPPKQEPEPLPEPIPDPIPEPESEDEQQQELEDTTEDISEPEPQVPEIEEPQVEEPEVPAEPEPEPEPTLPEEEPELEVEVPKEPLVETPVVEQPVPETAPIVENTHEGIITLDNGVVVTEEEAAAIALLQDPAQLLTELFTDPGAVIAALGSVGADMTPEVREKSEKVIISAVLAGNIATQAAASAASVAAYRRKP